MSETANYQLYLTDDDSTLFKEWREKINGTDNSNMVKIDTALAGKAQRSAIINATLTAGGWAGDAAPFQQVIAIDGLTAEQNGSASLAQNVSAEQLTAAKAASMRVSAQAEGTLTITADGDKPTVDIPIVVILLG